MPLPNDPQVSKGELHIPLDDDFDLPASSVGGSVNRYEAASEFMPRSIWTERILAMRSEVERTVPILGKWWLGSLAIISTIAALALRLVALDRLPGEMYGDIAIVYEYVAAIRARQWPTYFVLSAGPLYHYLITPLVSLAGFDFLGLKVASVTVSLAVLAGLFALGRELVDPELGLLAVFVGGVSSWLLIFSRLGNSQILVPVLTAAALYFCARVVRRGSMRDALLCGAISTLGLYVYPQSFLLAPVIFVILLWFYFTRQGVSRGHLIAFVSISALCALLFVRIVIRDPHTFFHGYIGSKLAPETGIAATFLANTLHSMLALHVHGDSNFRSNPASLPELDPLSGLLFLLGLAFWLRPERRHLSPLLLIPLLLLQLPSILVLGFPQEVPSASRMLAIAPLAYLLVASGIWWPLHALRRYLWQTHVAALVVLLIILVLNSYRYFTVYADGLPDHNTPFGRLIADYLDGLPANTHAFIVDCCWGQAGQPEPKGIQYGGQTVVSHGLVELHSLDLTCPRLQSLPQPSVLIWEPDVALPAFALGVCPGLLRPETHMSAEGLPVFRSSAASSP
ncbi:MAG: glycosyltransferase family 39 protein [Herpetosiphonaceae bacterium]|nr:glycosyltransferase family 39 protein [Herpetosiphonaceae bacterium]